MKVLFTLLFATYIATACSQAGHVDKLFGNAGLVKTAGDSSSLFDIGNAVALQSDGKIVISGEFSKHRPELIRYMPDGKVDYSFGENGIASINAFPQLVNNHHFFYDNSLLGIIRSIAIQPDGKIVVAGNSRGTLGVFAARFTHDGKLDTTFDHNGITAEMDRMEGYGVSAMVLQMDGKLLIAGGKPGIGDGEIPFDCGIVIRLNADGKVDISFAKDGIIVNEDSWKDEYVGAYNNNAIALQPDGKIITAGYQYGGMFTTINFVVNRYNSDGTPDSTFGNKGTVITNGNNCDDSPESIIVQADGKILIGGYSAADHKIYMMTALRYTANGILDPTFGNGGLATILFKERITRSCRALLQQNGKIILTGSVRTKNPENEEDFALCRIRENGSIDSSFGFGGKQVIVSPNASESFQTALLQPDGKIVLVSYSWYHEKLMAVLTRYIPGSE